MRPPEDAVAASTLTGQSLPIANDDTVRRYTRELIGRHRRAFLTVIALHSVAAVAGLAGPFVLGGIVNGLTGEPTTWSIDQAALIFIVALVVQTIFTRMSRLRAGIVGELALADLREDFLTRAVNLPTGVIERAGTGDLVSRTTTDIDRLTWAVRHAIPEISIAIVTAVLVLVALVVSAPTLALPWLLAVLPIWLSSRWYFARAPQAYRAESSTYAQVSASVAETVDAASTVELYRLEQGRIGVTDARIRRWVSWERYTLWLRCSWFPFIEMGYVLPLVGVLVWGGWQVSQGQITLGQLTTGLLLTQMLVEPVDQILMWYDELQVGQASLARLVGVRDVPDPETDPDLAPADDRLVVDDVRFGYRVGRDVLHGIDLDVAPGERLALVGPSGAGKSTLGRLMAGIYAPRTGSVEMGGAELARMPAESVRTQVALVNQEHHVFVGSVRDNLLLARPEADDDALVAALDAVDARPWFDELAEGLDTEVGQGGHALAPGQSQQLALARLVLADPHTLVLDEATSLLDPRAARHLERSLNAVLEGRTVIAIAHRLHTAHDADRIAVVEDGRVSELGTHDELVSAGGAYAALWRSWRDAD
jgi:ABC-type multidrug transport system fused ATPase/permease subunit